MTTLICTTSPLKRPSASLNRVRRMREALMGNGESVYIIGTDSQMDITKPFAVDDSLGCISYNPLNYQGRHITRSYRLAKQSATFYRMQLENIIKYTDAKCIILYTSFNIIAENICKIAHQLNLTVVVDMVEWQTISCQKLINGLTYEQSRLRRHTLPRTDGIMGISKAWCEWANERDIPNVWIPSFADDTILPRSEDSTENAVFTIVFIGHWVSRECPKQLIQALDICLERGIEVQLIVLGNVGTGHRERGAMRELKKHPELNKRVEFKGYVSDADRDKYLANADAFILLRPESRETDMLFPTRLPEYLMTGNPVILSKTGSFPHLFEHGKDIWFVSPENRPQEIADAILYLKENPAERKKIGSKGRDTALLKMGVPLLGKRLTEFLATVQKNKEST